MYLKRFYWFFMVELNKIVVVGFRLIILFWILVSLIKRKHRKLVEQPMKIIN